MAGAFSYLRTTLTVLAVLAGATVHIPPARGEEARAKSYALLVGVRDYDSSKFNPLKYTENDVEDLGQLLSGKASFTEVRLLTTTRGKMNKADAPTSANIRTALQALLAGKTRHDTLLVAFSGHGMQMKIKAGMTEREESFFCPANAQVNDARTLLSLRKLFKDLKDSGAAVKLVLVDACRNDPQEGRSISPDTVPRPADGVAALFSCKSGERAFETPKLGKGHGVFFHYVLQGLKGEARNRKGEVTWSGLADFVTEKVSDGVPKLIGGGAQQTPQEIKNLTGKPPVLVANGALQPPPETKPLPGAPPVLPVRPVSPFIGRWAVSFDGWQMILDVASAPGVSHVVRSPGEKVVHPRIGTYYDKNDLKKGCPVTGVVQGNRIDFFPESKQIPRHFTYYLGEGNPDLMAGSHRDPNGSVWGGFACRLKSPEAFPTDGRLIQWPRLPEVVALAPGDRLRKGYAPESYLGPWRLQSGRTPTAIVLTHRDDSLVPADKKADYVGLKGNNVIALVHKRNPARIELTVQPPLAGQSAYHFHGQLLSWERGVAAGTTTREGARTTFGAMLVRERSVPSMNAPRK